MKKRVDLSTWCFVMTFLGLITLVLMLLYAQSLMTTFFAGAALIFMCGAALMYMPLAISVDEDFLNIHFSLRIKSIPLAEIESIELCEPPSVMRRRMCGSGGWFGYWGWFKEPTIGKYFAYYGKSSDCFLVTLKDGRKYMLGCQDPEEIVELVRSEVKI